MVWPKTTRVAAARETQTTRVPQWWFDVADLRLICLGVGPGVARSWLQSCPTCRVGGLAGTTSRQTVPARSGSVNLLGAQRDRGIEPRRPARGQIGRRQAHGEGSQRDAA